MSTTEMSFIEWAEKCERKRLERRRAAEQAQKPDREHKCSGGLTLSRHGVNGWVWHFDGDSGCKFTNKDGEGLFFQNYETGQVYQILGTCQYRGCETFSGMRRRLLRQRNS